MKAQKERELIARQKQKVARQKKALELKERELAIREKNIGSRINEKEIRAKEKQLIHIMKTIHDSNNAEWIKAQKELKELSEKYPFLYK